jgi:hypothetical protein
LDEQLERKGRPALTPSSKRQLHRFLNRGILVVTLVAGVYQLISLWSGFIAPITHKVWEIRQYSAIERSAIIHEDHEFSDFMSFLREKIPVDAKVILPPRNFPFVLTNFGFADYFLMPRELHNCGTTEIEACVLRLTGARSYIVAVGDFPPPDAADQVKEFLPFKDDLGVWIPE